MIHHDPSKGERPFVLGCYGRSPVTGKPTGSRHRWIGGDCCEFCFKYRHQVMSTPLPIKEK